MSDFNGAEKNDDPLIASDEIDGPGRTFFEDPVTDNILDALLEMSAALWVCQDRILVLEDVLSDCLSKDQKIDLRRQVEQHVASPDLQAERDRQRAAMIEKIFRSFTRRPVGPSRSPDPLKPDTDN